MNHNNVSIDVLGAKCCLGVNHTYMEFNVYFFFKDLVSPYFRTKLKLTFSTESLQHTISHREVHFAGKRQAKCLSTSPETHCAVFDNVLMVFNVLCLETVTTMSWGSLGEIK